METKKSRRSAGSTSICIGLVAVGAIVLGFVFDEDFFGSHDPSQHFAYFYGGSVASLAVLSIGLGILGVRAGSSKVGSLAGLLIGLLALTASILFLLGTMLVGG